MVPAGSVVVRVSSLSLTTNPERFTMVVPRLYNSIQSPGTPPFDSTSFTTTSTRQSFAAPLVDAAVVTNAPVGVGHRPYVVAACAVHA